VRGGGGILGIAMQYEIEVPDELRERLEKRAAASGMTLNQYIVRCLERVAAVPTEEEMFERLRNLPKVKTTRDPVDVIRAVRDGGRNPI
jgi:predicted DNA-binding protein